MPSHDAAAPVTTAELRDWLLRRAMPLWLANGLDRAGAGFHEFLTPGHYGCDADFRRLRVVTRQVYVFAEGHAAGVAGADEAVALGVDFLARHAALPGGGYAWRFDTQNRPTDTTLDLYDHAFVLLALAAAAAVLPAAPLRARALDLEHFIAARFTHPAGGYLESLPPALPRRQNPHMHLLEAMLAAHQAFGDQIFRRRAIELGDLFLNRLFAADGGALAEFFDDTLAPLRQDGAFAVEPGHHCEWVWLLHRLATLAGPDARRDEAAARLAGFTDRFGLHPATGDVIDGTDSTGRPTALSARLWPQTEQLKAAFLRADTSPALRAQAAARLGTWLLPDGLWHERADAAGTKLAGNAPASSLYHLTCAILTVTNLG